ncbi:NADH dehydrogenase ubiquinone 1 beta subcomplex subunit 8 [Musa troglodytarum]|uniref:NADH dehydrogenase ubiquinone 1 beta subcomplex subunit 8 n=1 Tax=Musa troglodytarum TaxID=320322 RepID=A0A9E7FFB3_9LILI|nr:NADH dehydrogenase ubiquinone 1 beta subcomplex subunit 8 [Musa troglodytarum]URD94448.1 NADH dehydrogenase ubiquinone 1 beta subcomplex subunit 8 [Musa troglodytarum]URD94449.1 NADH dehydrogenase ubiquinone 1 beta subcomplex subunit 8 [Musa troglodytarum]URD94450.1 NADH dehydrogenase ubiquinone 1 beta subcomplex subunit 8 [Musa troglodytarum]
MPSFHAGLPQTTKSKARLEKRVRALLGSEYNEEYIGSNETGVLTDVSSMDYPRAQRGPSIHNNSDPICHCKHRSELLTVLESSRLKQNAVAINGRKLEGVREEGEMAGRLSGVAFRIMGGNGIAARFAASALRLRSGMFWDNGTPYAEPCIDRLAPTVGKYEALAWLC